MVLGLFYSIIITGAFITLVIYCRLYCSVRDSAAALNIKYFFIYPLILFLCWTPAIVDLFYTNFIGSSTFTLRLVHLIASHTQGFINALAYGAMQRAQMLAAQEESIQSIQSKHSEGGMSWSSESNFIAPSHHRTMSISTINKREDYEITQSLRTALEDYIR